MKQGTGKSSMGGQKVEPKSMGVSPAAAAAPGIAKVFVGPQKAHSERGFHAPMAGSCNHKAGSQGKH